MSRETSKINEEEIVKEDIDFDNFQVVRKEFFSHTYDYSLSIRPDHIRFSASLVKRLANVYDVQFLMNPTQKRLIVRPCGSDDKDAVHWAYNRAKDGKKASRDIGSQFFSMKIYELFNWNTNYRYKVSGTIVESKGEMVVVFNFNDQEAFELGARGGNSMLPEEWRSSFGLPLPEHERNLKVSVLDGYARMEIIKKRNSKITVNKNSEQLSLLGTESEKKED